MNIRARVRRLRRLRERPSRGLGDTVAKVTQAIGIPPCAGCKKPQAAMKKLIPYRLEPEP